MTQRPGGFTVPGLVAPVRRSLAPVEAWQARLAQEAPRIPWDVFTNRNFIWKQGEHVGIIGPTGQGKTTLLMHLLPIQPYVVVFATKPRDATMDRLIASGYERMERWSSISPDRVPRRVLWPDAMSINSDDIQREVFKDALTRIYRELGWCVVIDEGSVMVEDLKLGREIKTYLKQGRSLSISLVFATQRPAFVPLEVYDQSTHLFFYRDNDERNLSRIAGISWRSADLIRYIVSNLEQYQALYINTRTGQMCRTRVPSALPPSIRGEV